MQQQQQQQQSGEMIELNHSRGTSQPRALPVDDAAVGGTKNPSPGTFILRKYNSLGLWGTLKDKLVEALPESHSADLDDLRNAGVAIWLSLSYYSIYFVALVFFVTSLTIAKSKEKFLSLTVLDPAQATCESIPLAVTSTFSVDKHGVWSSSTAYERGTGVYELDLAGSLMSVGMYQSEMERFSAWLASVSENAETWDYVSVLSAWYLLKSKTDTLEFRPFADMDLLSKGAAVDSFALTSQFCNMTSAAAAHVIARSASLDSSLRFSFQNPCPKFGPQGDKLSIDMHSIFVAFALNMGIIDTSVLVPIYELDNSAVYISPLYPDMFGVMCQEEGLQRACFAFADSDDIVYPFLSTANGDSAAPNSPTPLYPCTCPRDASNYYCNSGYSTVLSLLVSKDRGKALDFSVFNMLKSGLEHSQVRDKVAPISFAALFAAKNGSKLAPKLTREFESLASGNFSLYSFSFFSVPTLNSGGASLSTLAPDDAPLLHDVTPDNRPSIRQTACTNTLFRKQVLDSIAATPPVSLVQPYQSCQATTRAAFVTAAGVAAGNSALLASLFLGAALFIVPKLLRLLPPAVKKALEAEADRTVKEALQQQVSALTAAAARDSSERQQLLGAVTALSRRTEALEAALLLLQGPRAKDAVASSSSTLLPNPPPETWLPSDSAVGSPMHKRL